MKSSSVFEGTTKTPECSSPLLCGLLDAFFLNERNAVFIKTGAKRARNHRSPGPCKESAERITAF